MSSTTDHNHVIGIDIGTTYAYVGIHKGSSIEVIANEQGSRATPALIGFTNKERTIGEAAYNHQHLNQKNTIYHVKAMLGYKYKDEAFQAILKDSAFPFTVLEGADGYPRIELDLDGASPQQQFTVEELTSFLFKQMKQTASQFLGANVSQAVISIPAQYNEAQKAALLKSAELAELNVVSLCLEPIATALSYNLDVASSTGDADTVLVLDIGGVSSNISILQIQHGLIELLSSEVERLGGEDIDSKLVTFFTDEFKRKYDLDLRESARATTRLRHVCEKAKIVLSSSNVAPVEADALYEGLDLFTQISRAKFDTLCLDLFRKIIAPIERALLAASVDKEDITKIILSGGTCKIPKIHEILRRYFGVNISVQTHPDVCVAYGCALQASLLDAETQPLTSDHNSVALTAMSIGVETANNNMQVLIPKHTPLPLKKSFSFASAQKDNVLKIYEGELTRVASSNHLLTALKLAGPTQLDISIDAQANVTFKINDKTVTLGNSLKKWSKEQVEKNLKEGHQEHMELMEQNKALKQLLDVLSIRALKMKEDVLDEKMFSDAEKRVISKAVDDVVAWCNTSAAPTIISVSKEDIERKTKGLDLIYGSYDKKLKAKAAEAAATPAPTPSTSSAKPLPKPSAAPVFDDLD